MTKAWIPALNMLKNSWTLLYFVPVNLFIKLDFVSVNGPRKTYFVEVPLTWMKSHTSIRVIMIVFLYISGPEPKQTPVTMRIHPSRPQSMFHDSSSRVTPHARPLSSASPPDPARLLAEVSQVRSKPLSATSTSPVLSGLHSKQETVSPTVRPTNSTSSSTSPVLASLLAKQPPDSTSPSSMSDPDLLASPTPRSPGLASGSTITYKQFTELKDKVSMRNIVNTRFLERKIWNS